MDRSHDAGALERRVAFPGALDGGVNARHQSVDVRHVIEVHRNGCRGAVEPRSGELQGRKTAQFFRGLVRQVGQDIGHRRGRRGRQIGGAGHSLHALHAEALRIHRGGREVHPHLRVRQARAAAALAQVNVQVLGETAARVQSDGLRLAVDFNDVVLELAVQGDARTGEGPGCRLRGQRLQPVQDGGDVAHTAVHDLELRRGVVAVGNALGQFRHRAAEFVGDREARRIVARLVDPVAGSQLGDGLALECAGDAQVLLGDKGVYVGLDRNHF